MVTSQLVRQLRALMWVLCALRLDAASDVLTANYGNERTNSNLSETILTPANVNPLEFGKAGSYSVDAQVYAQPLYVAGVRIPSHGLKNVLYVVTMANSIYAFDADAACGGSPLWNFNLGPAIGTRILALREVGPQVGILSTPVIDRRTNTMYLVAEIDADGSPSFELHAIDLSDGTEKMNGPVTLTASVPGSGDATDGVRIAFDPKQHLQRPGLLLANNLVYIAFGSIYDRPPYHGWILSYNAANIPSQKAVLNTTPNGGGGGIWQSGRGLASDAAGNVYTVTGNGDFDGVTNFGEAFLKLSPDLKPLDWFAPEDWEELSNVDYDLGSMGPVLVPGSDAVIGGDKAGDLYVVNRRNMGRLGTKGSSDPQIFQPAQYGGLYNMALWPRTSGSIAYLIEAGEWTGAFQINGSRMETEPFSIANVTSDWPFQGMAVSANGDESGILWMTAGDHFYEEGIPGVLYAFDGEDVSNLLWTSDLNPERDALGTFAKFATPTVANGRVYVPTFSNAVAVYGLLGNKSEGCRE